MLLLAATPILTEKNDLRLHQCAPARPRPHSAASCQLPDLACGESGGIFEYFSQSNNSFRLPYTPPGPVELLGDTPPLVIPPASRCPIQPDTAPS